MNTTRALRAALAATLALAAAPAFGQTDDRVLNDVFAVLRGETLLARTRQLCLEFAETDLEADFSDWTGRNLEVLQRADRLITTRAGLDLDALGDARQAAAAEAEQTFSREADRPAFCESIGETMEAGQLDLAAWFPAETQRMTEAEAGQWPPLDLDGVRPIADAMTVKQIFFVMGDVFVRCGVLFPPAAPFVEARAEWEARNHYTRELADRVLRNWGALHPSRWEAARDEAGAEVDALFADAARAEAHCRATASRAMTGEEDIDQVRPDLYESVLANAEIVPM